MSKKMKVILIIIIIGVTGYFYRDNISSFMSKLPFAKDDSMSDYFYDGNKGSYEFFYKDYTEVEKEDESPKGWGIGYNA